MIVCCILWRNSTLGFRITSFRNYSGILTHYVCWRNFAISLFLWKHALRDLTLGMVVSTVRSLLFITLLILWIRLLLLLMLLLLQLLELLMSSKHAFDIIARHWTWARISVAIQVALNTICELWTVIVMRRRQLRSNILSPISIVLRLIHACVIAVNIWVHLIARLY